MNVPSEQQRITPKQQSRFRFPGRLPETAMRARTNIEWIIVNFPRAEIRTGFESRADMLSVSMGQ